MDESMDKPTAVAVEGEAPVKKIDSEALRRLGGELAKLFKQYAGDRRLVEEKWTRNLRQYLGIYDPSVEEKLPPHGSRAYPRVTRAKCISILSRLMNLMFQGTERNWEVGASPSADMDPEDVAQAVQDLIADRKAEGLEAEPTEDFIDSAVQMLAKERAKRLSRLIDDQMQELGGDQTDDYVALNRRVLFSGILYGMGALRGPFVREIKKTQWMSTEEGDFAPVERTIYKPQYEFHPVWDVYPDMTAKKLPGDGYFIRMVMGRSDVRKLADRPGFMSDQVKSFLKHNQEGNYSPREFETDLRSMGTKANTSENKPDPQGKYEVIMWNGPLSARKLEEVGVDVADAKKGDDIEAEVWLIDGHVIKADINPWRKMGVKGMRTIHFFQFDEDDTSPVGNGLPYVIRDSQMSICAATRMALDNASVTCAPNLEVNMSLLRPDQDLTNIEPWKIWYRDDEDPATTAMARAVTKIDIDGHLQELMALVAMFRESADMESFAGPQTGGDMSQTPSEPMRTAAGQSMMRGDAALPFKDIVRNFDSFTQSVILSLVQFNRKFNPALAPAGDYNVIARGASSLVAKEVRAMQLDALAQTLQPEDRDHIDERLFTEARFLSRDLGDMLVAPEVAKRRQDSRAAQAAEMSEMQKRQIQAEIRDLLSGAFKNITQGQKNAAAADATVANSALDILEAGTDDGDEEGGADQAGG